MKADNMRKLLYLIYIGVAAAMCTACESKWDENGDLDGMWQLTEWRDRASGAVVKTNADSVYYCVQLKLIKFQNMAQTSYYLCYFTQTSDSLVIGKVTTWPANEEKTFAELAPYGVPANGRFHIDALSKKRMRLSSNAAFLTFRKY